MLASRKERTNARRTSACRSSESPATVSRRRASASASPSRPARASLRIRSSSSKSSSPSCSTSTRPRISPRSRTFARSASPGGVSAEVIGSAGPSSVAGDVAAEEDEVGDRERDTGVQGADPERARDRGPVGRDPQEAVPGLELRAEQVGTDRLGAGEHAEELHEQRPHQSADDGGGAVPRHGREHQPEGGDPGERQRVDREAREQEEEPAARGDLGAGERGERPEAPGGAPRREADEPHREDEDERVRRGRERLPGEHLAALARAGEDRLQRAVVALGGDDVAGDERGHERQAPDRHEEEDDERHREPGVADGAPERDVGRPALLQHEHDDEHDRHEHRRAEPEVRPLLREELRELPAVHAGDGGHPAAATARSWSADSPPVRPRKSSSRLARSGTSAVTPIRAWPSLTVSAATASSSAVKRSSPSRSATSPTPGWASAAARARSGSVARSR